MKTVFLPSSESISRITARPPWVELRSLNPVGMIFISITFDELGALLDVAHKGHSRFPADVIAVLTFVEALAAFTADVIPRGHEVMEPFSTQHWHYPFVGLRMMDKK